MLAKIARLLAPNSSLALPKGSRRTYYHAPHLGLHGHMDYRRRLHGYDMLLPYLAGRTLLDLGCAEGVILDYLARGNYAAAHGVDNSPQRIETARRLFAGRPLRFDVADLNRTDCFDAAYFEPGYDVVLLLGVYQHLIPERRERMLREALERCRDLFVLRIPNRYRGLCNMQLMAEAGFGLHHVHPLPGGDLRLFRRRPA